MKKDPWALQLLDDGDQVSHTAKANSHAWNNLTQKILDEKPVLPPQVQQAIANGSSSIVLTAKNTKVFSSRPTLRQMMADYNKRPSSRGPIKSSPASNTAPTSQSFQFEQVTSIRIPTIPGRILRPAR